MVEAERVEREEKITKLQKDIDTESRIRAKGIASVREFIKEELAKLDVRVIDCEQEREKATEEVVKALVHYSAALHDGVKIVSEAVCLIITHLYVYITNPIPKKLYIYIYMMRVFYAYIFLFVIILPTLLYFVPSHLPLHPFSISTSLIFKCRLKLAHFCFLCNICFKQWYN